MVDPDLEFDFNETPLVHFNAWCIQDVISFNEDGVDTSLVLYLGSDEHDKKIGVLLDVYAAAYIARDLLSGSLDVGL